MHVEARPNESRLPVRRRCADILSLEEELRLARDGDAETENHRISSSSGGGGSNNVGDLARRLFCLNEAMHAAARILNRQTGCCSPRR